MTDSSNWFPSTTLFSSHLPFHQACHQQECIVIAERQTNSKQCMILVEVGGARYLNISIWDNLLRTGSLTAEPFECVYISSTNKSMPGHECCLIAVDKS